MLPGRSAQAGAADRYVGAVVANRHLHRASSLRPARSRSPHALGTPASCFRIAGIERNSVRATAKAPTEALAPSTCVSLPQRPVHRTRTPSCVRCTTTPRRRCRGHPIGDQLCTSPAISTPPASPSRHLPLSNLTSTHRVPPDELRSALLFADIRNMSAGNCSYRQTAVPSSWTRSQRHRVRCCRRARCVASTCPCADRPGASSTPKCRTHASWPAIEVLAAAAAGGAAPTGKKGS